MNRRILLALFLILFPISAWAQNNGLSLGYGLGALNPHQETGKVEEDRNYNFFQFAYFYEWLIFKNGLLVLEPILAYVIRPESGMDLGLNLLFRYYVKIGEETSLFGTLGAGVAYTTVDFKEQDTHLLLSPQIGIGFRWGRFFIEDRLRHYSNGGLSSPNRDVNANILSIGIYF